MNIELRLFGAFRALGDHLSLALPDGATTSDLSAALQTHITEHEDLRALLPVTKFSTDTDVLSPGAALSAGQTYAVLPPVSGG